MAYGAVLISLGLVACGDDATYSSANELPDDTVAAVGDREITRAELRERAKLLAPGQVRPGDERPAQAELEQQAVGLLVEEAALEREAADRGIRVSDREVRRRWEAVSSNQFRTRRQLRQFLGGQSVEALLVQLRAQMLRQAIVADVQREANGDPAEAIKRWESDFHEQTQKDTVCRERYAGAGCPTDGGS